MSNILWLLYLADVVSALSVIFGLSGVILALLMIIISCVQCDNEGDSDNAINTFMRLMRVRLILPAVLILLACLMPSKQLLYIAVGLDVGSQVVESEIGQKSLDALEAWLDKAIADSTSQK